MRTAFGARVVLAVVATALLASVSSASQQQDIPPPPPENFAPVTEAEVLAKLPERERALIQRENDLKSRFDAHLAVSEMRLAEIGAKLDAKTGPVLDSLLLYESVLRVADQIIRSPQAKAAPRDKRYKQFERRLTKQIPLLKTMIADLSFDESTTGAAILETVQRLRTAALNSALDSEILTPEQE